MNLTPGELVEVTPPGGAGGTRIGGPIGQRQNITIQVFGVQTPANFIALESQLRRGIGRMFR
jgi:hypothetical protein